MMRSSRRLSALRAAIGLLVIGLPSVARAQLVVGPAIDMDAPVLSPAPMLQYATSATSDGTNFLVALLASDFGAGTGSTYFALVRADGSVATSPSIPMNSAGGRPLGSVVAFNATTYGTVTHITDTVDSIDFTRVGTDGRFLDDAPVRVPFPARISSLQIAATSTTWLVTAGQGAAIGLTRFRADGSLLDSNPMRFGSPYRLQRAALAGTTDGAMLVYEQLPGDPSDTTPPRIVARPLDVDGNVLGTSGTILSSSVPDQLETAIAYSSGAYLVAWLTYAGVDAIRVDATGHALDAAPISIATRGTSLALEDLPAVVAQSDGWLVTWNRHAYDPPNYGSVLAVRVSSAGTVLDAAPVVLPGIDVGGSRTLAWNGSTTLVVRNEIVEAGTHALAQRMSPALAPLDAPTTVLRALNGESFVALSNGPHELLAGWFDGRLGPSGAIAFLRLGSDGTPRTTPAQTVATNTASPVRDLVITSSDTGYLATWSEADKQTFEKHVRAIRLDADGVPVDVAPVTLRSCSLDGDLTCIRTSATYDGADFVVVLGTRNGFEGAVQVWRFGPSGAPREVTLPGVVTANGFGIGVGSNGDGSLVVFDHGSTLSFERMSRDGTLLDASPREFSPMSFMPADFAQVVAHGSDYVVFAYTSYAGLNVWRIAADGTVLDTPIQITSPFVRENFSVSDTGSDYLLTWDHTIDYLRETVGALRVGYDGVPIDSTNVDLLPESMDRPYSRSATLPSGDAVLAYQLFDLQPDASAWRLHVRTLSTRTDAGSDGGAIDASGSDVGGPDVVDVDGGAIESDAIDVDTGAIDAGGFDAIQPDARDDGATDVDALTVDAIDDGATDVGALAMDVSDADATRDAGIAIDSPPEASVDVAAVDGAPDLVAIDSGPANDVTHVDDIPTRSDRVSAEGAIGAENAPVHDASCRCDLRTSRTRAANAFGWWAMAFAVAALGRRRAKRPLPSNNGCERLG